ncbi:hypothetical protein KCU69_g70, partial [Aureobasidium melanogenum]
MVRAARASRLLDSMLLPNNGDQQHFDRCKQAWTLKVGSSKSSYSRQVAICAVICAVKQLMGTVAANKLTATASRCPSHGRIRRYNLQLQPSSSLLTIKNTNHVILASESRMGLWSQASFTHSSAQPRLLATSLNNLNGLRCFFGLARCTLYPSIRRSRSISRPKTDRHLAPQPIFWQVVSHSSQPLSHQVGGPRFEPGRNHCFCYPGISFACLESVVVEVVELRFFWKICGSVGAIFEASRSLTLEADGEDVNCRSLHDRVARCEVRTAFNVFAKWHKWSESPRPSDLVYSPMNEQQQRSRDSYASGLNSCENRVSSLFEDEIVLREPPRPYLQHIALSHLSQRVLSLSNIEMETHARVIVSATKLFHDSQGTRSSTIQSIEKHGRTTEPMLETTCNDRRNLMTTYGLITTQQSTDEQVRLYEWNILSSLSLASSSRCWIMLANLLKYAENLPLGHILNAQLSPSIWSVSPRRDKEVRSWQEGISWKKDMQQQ